MTAGKFEMDGAAFRAAGHDLVERIADWLDGLGDLPVAPATTPAAITETRGHGGLPDEGAEPGPLLARAFDLLAPATCLNAHPRMWGYITGSPAPIGALADMLTAAINPNVAGWNGAPMATAIEEQTVAWVGDLLGYPAGGGLFTSGGNAANLVGIVAARHAFAGDSIRAEGLRGRRLTLYATDQCHAWIEKAADLLGLGMAAIRRVPADGAARMDVAAGAAMIAADRTAGMEPFLIVGTAGTTAVGAVDPLPAIADLAEREGLWFHVDGCYGAPAACLPDAPADLLGLRRADSLAVDAHKWLYVPLEAGCALVRDGARLKAAFSTNPSYYALTGAEEVTDYYAWGPQNSRGFRALKVWLALQQAGRSGYREAIARNIAQARLMFAAAQEARDFEAGLCSLSIATFRYVPADLMARRGEPAVAAWLDRLNGALMGAVQRSGDLYLSNAVISGAMYLRACIVNFRTGDEDARSVPARVRAIAEPLAQEMRGELAA
jgi:aromatic-L-amino-acid/L-tryptophan decarboxylase